MYCIVQLTDKLYITFLFRFFFSPFRYCLVEKDVLKLETINNVIIIYKF